MALYGELLDKIGRSAAAAGWKARAALAKTHRECLAARYGV
ncbi:MAG: hypothetical protein AAGA03_18945 [Planctomycetota bacterium]